MLVRISHCGEEIEYLLERKNVKNINLRIKPNGSVCVSASPRVPRKTIDDFVVSKWKFVQDAIEKQRVRKDAGVTQHFTENELRNAVLDICRRVYPYYRERGIDPPQIKFRKMVSRWGSCHPVSGVLTFNTHLMYAPYECVEYVVWHEFTHFLQANHSRRFYIELEKVCPDWKLLRNRLREICIPG